MSREQSRNFPQTPSPGLTDDFLESLPRDKIPQSIWKQIVKARKLLRNKPNNTIAWAAKEAFHCVFCGEFFAAVTPAILEAHVHGQQHHGGFHRRGVSPSQGQVKLNSLSPSKVPLPSPKRHEKKEVCSFGDPWPGPEKTDEPLFYESFHPFIFQKPMSRQGTFPTSERKTLQMYSMVPVAFYDSPADGVGDGPPGSHGVVRTSQRWMESEIEASPGPIYFPDDLRVVKGMKFSQAERFPNPKVVKPRKVLAAAMFSPDNQISMRKKQVCTFGIRWPSADRRPSEHSRAITPPVAANDKNQSKDSVVIKSTAPLPSAVILNNKRPPSVSKSISNFSPEKIRVKDVEITPGPGHFLKSDFVSGAPRWSMGRRTRSQDLGTPGPGAYRIEKAWKSGKPNVCTFTKTSHCSLFFHGEKGVDSPGPALYSKLL